ncbi:hypothetical protein L3V83_02735 [Thiotrichales bacterium 19X7-9]|nr:hypothetical protein [Thiotrichales bacterium 19X7-9]
MFEQEIEMLQPSSFDPNEEASSSKPVKDSVVNGLIAGEVIPEPSTIENSDQLRNVNSFFYLREIASIVSKNLKELSGVPAAQFVSQLCASGEQYKKSTRYGDLYSDFLTQLQGVISKLHKEEIAPSSATRDQAKK